MSRTASLRPHLRILDSRQHTGEYPRGAFYVRFASDQDDTIVLLKSGKQEEHVDAADILSAAITLDGRGVIDRDRFARLLAQHTQQATKAA